MPKKYEDEHDLDDLLMSASDNLQDAWKSKEEQANKKSLKFIILRDIAIVLGVLCIIMFVFWNLYNKDTVFMREMNRLILQKRSQRREKHVKPFSRGELRMMIDSEL